MDSLPESDYASAFELPVEPASTRTPEEWARGVFEGAPPVLRRFMRAGWRFPLRFRLAPRGAPGHILGCRIIRNEGTAIVLEQRSPLMTAHNIVFVERTRIVWTTLVRYRRPIARPLWSVPAAITIASCPTCSPERPAQASESAKTFVSPKSAAPTRPKGGDPAASLMILAAGSKAAGKGADSSATDGAR